MWTFQIPDMTCGHCVGTITQAVQRVDPAARVQVDLPQHIAQVHSATLDLNKVQGLLEEAGFSPQLLA